MAIQSTSICWSWHSWSWRRARGKITTKCSVLPRMPLRMRSKKPIANELWCTTQVFPLFPWHSECESFLYLYFCCLFLISFVLWHQWTDRHSSATAEVQKEEEKKFKEVGEAFTVLSDPKKKIRYDNGHDLDDDGGFSGRGTIIQYSSVNFCEMVWNYSLFWKTAHAA